MSIRSICGRSSVEILRVDLRRLAIHRLEHSPMLDLFKQTITQQYTASLCTLAMCIGRCPDELWQTKVARFPFSQSAFHTLFFTDLYLCEDIEAQRQQPYHVEHATWFADYEQLEERDPTTLYERGDIQRYLQFCRRRAEEVMAAETADSLAAVAGFSWRRIPRAELHVYSIRHIQHHAAQLILKLRLEAQMHFPWIGSGWQKSD